MSVERQDVQGITERLNAAVERSRQEVDALRKAREAQIIEELTVALQGVIADAQPRQCMCGRCL